MMEFPPPCIIVSFLSFFLSASLYIFFLAQVFPLLPITYYISEAYILNYSH